MHRTAMEPASNALIRHCEQTTKSHQTPLVFHGRGFRRRNDVETMSPNADASATRVTSRVGVFDKPAFSRIPQTSFCTQSTESPILFRSCPHCGHETPFSDQNEASKIGDSVLCLYTSCGQGNMQLKHSSTCDTRVRESHM